MQQRVPIPEVMLIQKFENSQNKGHPIFPILIIHNFPPERRKEKKKKKLPFFGAHLHYLFFFKKSFNPRYKTFFFLKENKASKTLKIALICAFKLNRYIQESRKGTPITERTLFQVKA